MPQPPAAPLARAARLQPDAARAQARQWMTDHPFNLAIDYWTFVHCRPYGSGVTREVMLPILRELKPGFFQVYAKGETGHTSFKSVTGSTHPSLAGDMLAEARAATSEAGVKFFVYWSGLEDGVAAQAHPQWCALDQRGQPVRFFERFLPPGQACSAICPQSDFLEKWVAVQLRELIAHCQPDGMWIDGTWLPPCWCDRCVGRYRQERGPAAPLSGLEWNRYWAGVQCNFRARFIAVLRSISPNILASFGNISARSEFCEDRDWLSGDWYSPNAHRLHQSAMMRRYSSTGMVYESWICDTQMMHALTEERTRSKTLPRILQEGAGIIANGGIWTYWTFPMPDGGPVPSRMRKAAAAGKFFHERSQLCKGTTSVQWVGIIDMEPHSGVLRPALFGAARSMIELQRSPDVLEENALAAEGAPYDLLIVPEQPWINPQLPPLLEAFVRRGGKLLTTGPISDCPEMQRLLGVELVHKHALAEGHVFRADGESTGIYAPWDQLRLTEATELYPLYRSYDDANPGMKTFFPNYAINGLVDERNPHAAGFPAVTIRKLGKGLAVHVASELFLAYERCGYPDILAFLRELLDRHLQPQPLFQSDAPQCVEFSLRRQGQNLLIHLINGNSGRDLSLVHSHDLWVDAIPPLHQIHLSVDCPNQPQQVTLEPGNQSVPWQWQNGRLEVTVAKLEIHSCVVVKPWRG